MRGFLTDIKLAVRSLSATRWTTTAAVLILALGTGVNTAVLAVAYGILLRPLPYAEPSRLVVVGPEGRDGQASAVPAGEFDDWRDRLRTVEKVSAYSPGEFTIRGAGEPRVVRAAIVKGDFFALMGVPAAEGRFAPAGEDDWAAVGARLARQLRTNGPLVGSGLSVGQAGYTVTAILPDRFTFPADDIVLWLPSSSRTALGFAARPDARSFRLIARLRPGVTLVQAREDAARVLREVRPPGAAGDRRPGGAEEERATVTTLDAALTGRVKPILGALLAAAVLVLLVACGNVASLFIGRAAGAQQDLAVRVALGATRWRIVRGVLAESLVVAAVSAAAGAGIGLALVRLFVGLAAGILPRLDAVAIDAPVIAAASLVAFFVALLCGALPALHAVRGDLAPAFRTVVASSSRPARRLRAALVAVQIALSVVLLAGAGLVIRTVAALLDQATGIEPRQAVSLRLVMSDRTTFGAGERTPFIRQVVERALALPGVRAAGVGSALPPRVAPLALGLTVNSKGRSQTQVLTLVSVTPGYLPALGARLVRGRMLDESDFTRSDPVALMSESAARHLSPSGDPVGRPLVFPLPAPNGVKGRKPEIVGIVRDIKFSGLDSSAAGTIYVMWPDLPAGVGYLVVRANGDPGAVVASLRQLVRDIDPNLPIPDVRSLDDEILASIADRRLRLVPAVSFGVLALVVALVGLSAAMTRAVNERRRELAIRSALGASPARTLRMVVREGAVVTSTGVAVGLGVAAAVSRTLASLLFGVTPHDALTFSTAAVLVAAGGLGVCWIVGRRAARGSVLDLLRSE
jgi:putative ABC transport system permease protein